MTFRFTQWEEAFEGEAIVELLSERLENLPVKSYAQLRADMGVHLQRGQAEPCSALHDWGRHGGEPRAHPAMVCAALARLGIPSLCSAAPRLPHATLVLLLSRSVRQTRPQIRRGRGI